MNLFSQLVTEPTHEEIFPGAVLMRSLALEQDRELFEAIESVATVAPFRAMITPGGQKMSILGTGCGKSHRVSSLPPIRFTEGAEAVPQDAVPMVEAPQVKPPMPVIFREFSIRAAALAGFPRFKPDAAHFNRYHAGTKLGLHQDRHECDLSQPIVSVSLGLSAVFLLGGFERTNPIRRILLEHGDVIVWGGPSRMRFHGVTPLKPGSHPLVGHYRYNITFRKIAPR